MCWDTTLHPLILNTGLHMQSFLKSLDTSPSTVNHAWLRQNDVTLTGKAHMTYNKTRGFSVKLNYYQAKMRYPLDYME